MRPKILPVSVAAGLLAAVTLPAQLVGTGKFVATTLDATTPAAATSTLQIIDPYTKTTTPITFAKTFPPSSTTEGPDSLLVESAITMLVGTRVINGTGNVYRITFGGNGWNHVLLNSASTSISSVGGLAVIGNTIYMAGANIIGSTGNSALCMSMPSNGGSPQIYVDVVKSGATGLGNALCAVGTDLHYFTFESTTSTISQSEHWKIDTTATTPTAVRVANLPLSKRLTTSNFGVVQAAYDPNTKLLVIAGCYGDVLWRDLTGKDIRHVITGTTINYIDGLAVNTDTGTVGIGDRAGNYEELRCDGNSWKDTYLALPSPITTVTRLSNLVYVPASPNNLAFGSGCNQSTGTAACNYSNILPAKGSSTFTFTLEGPTQRAILVLGAKSSRLDMTGMGAPGCVLQVSMDVLVPGAITSTGASVGPIPIPSSVPDVSVFTQWLLTDSVNSMGVVVTDARQLDVR